MNRITNHQLYRLITAHFAEIIREPAVIFWGVVFPILMAWGLGIAFTQKGDVHISLAIVKVITDQDTVSETKLAGYLAANGIRKDSTYSIDLKNEKLGNVSLTFFETSWPNANTMLTPMMVVSGVFFSYHNFPEWAIPVIKFLPLTMIADSFRSIFNEGAGFVDVWREALVLTSIGTVSFIVGLKIFKWY